MTEARWDTGLTAFADEVHRMAKAARDTPALMRRVAAYGRSSAVRRVHEGRVGGPPLSPATVAAKGSSLPLRDRGRYVNSFSQAHGRDFASWGSNDIRARLLSEGGTVRPKRAKMLAFPISADGRRAIARYGSPRAAVAGMRAAGIRVWRSRSGKALLFARGKDAPVRVLFALARSITVPARPHFILDDDDEREIARLVEDWFRSR